LTPPVILPYRGYGTPKKIFLRGHVLDDRLLFESKLEDKRKKNLLAMLSRYVSEGIPEIRVEINFNQQTTIVETDEQGLFEVEIELKESCSTGWHEVTYQVLDEIVENQKPLEEKGEVLIADGKNQHIIVSDVDDTILISHATQTLRKLRLILTKNSKTRLPFLGVASFYKALNTGNPPTHNNPIFYVSSSEWNLYDFLEDFCEVRNIPKGPFMLQELKTSLWKLIKSGGGTHSHKKDKILHLMDIYPEQKFILIGDSGQRDAALYKSITEERPNQVLTIYIRDVGKKKKAKKVSTLAEQFDNQVEMVLVEDSYEAAKHAFKKGYINEEELNAIEQEFEKQKQKPESLLEQSVKAGQED
jgi:phosphatidate phosphatase APP1